MAELEAAIVYVSFMLPNSSSPPNSAVGCPARHWEQSFNSRWSDGGPKPPRWAVLHRRGIDCVVHKRRSQHCCRESRSWRPGTLSANVQEVSGGGGAAPKLEKSTRTLGA